MKLQSLRIREFRGIRELDLRFPERLNVLVGANGAGKSAVLDCAAVLLSRFIGRIRSSHGTGRFFSETDISNGRGATGNEIEIALRGRSVRWTVAKTRKGRRRQTITRLGELKEQVEAIHASLEEDETARLPLAVYYPVNRAVLDIPLRIRKRHRFDRLAAYDQALSGGAPTSFRVFFEWFREREDLENERRLERRAFRDPQLRAVRRAIEAFLPGFTGLKVKRSPLRMVVKKDREELSVSQLSDGEKCTLALAGDLARRMAVANPDMTDPLETEAIVLIDEIDLHLHPAWQRQVTTWLTHTFPNSQFILTTHSPQILGHLDCHSVWLLDRGPSGVVAERPEAAFGQTSNRVLEDLMGVPERPQEIKHALTELFLLIERGETVAAKRRMRDMHGKICEDPDLVKVDVLIRRKESLGE